ncbi:MAG: hypothetical protein OEX12_06105 [Gammaproteobacteria bacterium]|nr:hypothetical protein [Gammaproteobacteria bacterium]
MIGISDELWKHIQEVAHTTAKEKGWWDAEPRPWPVMQCLFASEVIEAFEWTRKGMKLDEIVEVGNEVPPKKEGPIVDLADLIIRVADYAESIGSLYTLSSAANDSQCRLIEVKYYSSGLEGYNRDCTFYMELLRLIDNTSEFNTHLLLLIAAMTIIYCDHYSPGAIAETIQSKMSYNAYRSYRHGGKVL